MAITYFRLFYPKETVMLETHLKTSVTCQRLRAGPAAEHIDGFADWLHGHGYTPVTIKGMLVSLAGWTDWMVAAGYTAQELIQGFEACKAVINKTERIPFSRGPNRYSVSTAGGIHSIPSIQR